MHGTEHHLEEAEHAKHAHHDPFDRRVAMSMAIVAAILACDTLLSHRSHNSTLQNQILATQYKTAAVDQWGYYQAKKNRQYALEAQSQQVALAAVSYTGEQKEKADKLLAKWKAKTESWEQDTRKIQQEARRLDEEAGNYQEKSESVHHKSDFFDLGELGIELSLVLCSIAVLTKQKGFWYSGILICAIGLGVALYGFAAPPHASHAPDHSPGAPAHKSEGTTGGSKDHKSDKDHHSPEQKPAKSH